MQELEERYGFDPSRLNNDSSAKCFSFFNRGPVGGMVPVTMSSLLKGVNKHMHWYPAMKTFRLINAQQERQLPEELLLDIQQRLQNRAEKISTKETISGMEAWLNCVSHDVLAYPWGEPEWLWKELEESFWNAWNNLSKLCAIWNSGQRSPVGIANSRYLLSEFGVGVQILPDVGFDTHHGCRFNYYPCICLYAAPASRSYPVVFPKGAVLVPINEKTPNATKKPAATTASTTAPNIIQRLSLHPQPMMHEFKMPSASEETRRINTAIETLGLEVMRVCVASNDNSDDLNRWSGAPIRQQWPFKLSSKEERIWVPKPVPYCYPLPDSSILGQQQEWQKQQKQQSSDTVERAASALTKAEI